VAAEAEADVDSKTAIIALFRSKAKEHGFVDSPGQSELDDDHRTNRLPAAGSAVTVPRVPSSPWRPMWSPHGASLGGESAWMRTQLWLPFANPDMVYWRTTCRVGGGGAGAGVDAAASVAVGPVGLLLPPPHAVRARAVRMTRTSVLVIMPAP
jgi:hypothetical protein